MANFQSSYMICQQHSTGWSFSPWNPFFTWLPGYHNPDFPPCWQPLVNFDGLSCSSKSLNAGEPRLRPQISPLLCTYFLGELIQTQSKDRITHGLTVCSHNYIWSKLNNSLELHTHVPNCILKLLLVYLTGISHLTRPEETLVPPPLGRMYVKILTMVTSQVILFLHSNS